MTEEQLRENEEICLRLQRMAAELREIVKKTGQRISMAADISLNYGDQNPVHSTIFAGNEYRIDHYNTGEDRIMYKNYTIQPCQLAIGEVAPGFEYEIRRKSKK